MPANYALTPSCSNPQGPELMTCGPYRPITLKTFTARIADIHPRASVLFNKDTDTYVPTLKMDLEIDGWSMSDLTTLIMLKDPKKGSVIRQEEVGLGTFEKRAIRDAVVWTLEGEGMKLWWPVRYGEQCLYNVEVILLGLVSHFCPLDMLLLMSRWIYVLEWSDARYTGQAYWVPHRRACPRVAR